MHLKKNAPNMQPVLVLKDGPRYIFFCILYIGGVHGHIVHQCATENSKIEKADELVRPHLYRRAENTTLKCDIRAVIRRILSLLDP